MNTNVTLLLLAGGRSSRFWPLPHKMTLLFTGKSFLEKQLELVKDAGFKDIVVVVNSELAGRFSGEGITVVEQKGEGQGAAILSSAPQIKGRAVLVVNADDIVSKNLLESVPYFIHNDHHVIVGYKTPQYFPGGYLVLDGKYVRAVQEKPARGSEPSEFIKLVCDYFTSADTLLSFLEKESTEDSQRHYENTLSAMMKNGEVFEMLEYEDVWIPLKYPWQTLSIMDYYLGKIKKKEIAEGAYVHRTATIAGPVVIERGARVMEYAKVVGPTYIGAGAIIGNHTLIRAAQIGENTVVGFGSEITRSYIGSNCWFHTNYVGDSVFADNVGVGAGAVFANLRLDEREIHSHIHGEKIGTERVKLGTLVGEGARIGVEAQLMPGVKVGKQSIVGPGVILQQDLPDHKRCFLKQEHLIEEDKNTLIQDRNRFRSQL